MQKMQTTENELFGNLVQLKNNVVGKNYTHSVHAPGENPLHHLLKFIHYRTLTIMHHGS